MTSSVAGVEPGRRRLDGSQTTGRGYRNPSAPEHGHGARRRLAMTQFEAAVEQPPHLTAILPLAGTVDRFEAAVHNGLMSPTFVTSSWPWSA